MVMMTREEYYAQIKEMYAQKYESPSMKAWRSGSDHFERSGDDRWFSEEDRRFREYLMSRNDDDDETWTWTEHYSVMDDETDWWYRSEKEDPEDQSLDDGELVETEVVTESDGIEQQTVNNEENANENLDILEEESITQIQVPVSRLESSLQFHNASSDICDDFKSSLFGHQEAMLQVSHVKVRDELPTKSTDVTNNQAAHYLFDKMPLRMQSKRRHIKCHKSWRFKFKHRVASRESKAGFEVNMKHNQFKEMLLQLLLSGTHKKRQRETPKYHKSWKFRFKKMDMKFQEVIVDDVLSVMVCLCVPNKKFEAGLEIYGCETKKQMLLLMKLANRVWECGELLATSQKMQKMDLFSFDTHTEMEENVELRQLLVAMERFSQEVIEQKIEGGLSCGDVKFHLKHKWRFRLLESFSMVKFGKYKACDALLLLLPSDERFQIKHKWRFRPSHSFSEMKQRMIGRVWKSFGYLMEDMMEEDQKLQGDSEPLLPVPDFAAKICEAFDQYIRKKGSVSADRESERNQPTLRFSTWIIEILLNHYMVLLLTPVAYAIHFLGGVGMDTKQSHLSLWVNRVWDPGRSLVKDASYSTRIFSSLPATVPVSLLCLESFAYQKTSVSTNLEVKVSLKGEDVIQDKRRKKNGTCGT